MLGIARRWWLRWPAHLRLMAALLTLGGVVATMLAGCTPPSLTSVTPTGSPTEQTPPLHFILDANALAAKSNSDLRYSLAAVDTHDGHLAWRHKLEAPAPDVADSAFTPPVLANGLVYLGYYVFDPQQQIHHAVLEALDPATGQLRWRHVVDPQDETEIVDEPVVSGATVYLSVEAFRGQGEQRVEAGLVEALDGRTGAVRWDKELPQPPSMAAVADGRVFVMTSQTFSGHLIALNAQNGTILWDYAADAPLLRGGDADNGWSHAPIVSGQRVYAQATERFPDGSADVVQLAVNAADGTLAWKYDTKGIAATPSFDQSGDIVCLSAYLYNESSVVGLDASTGNARWHLTLPGITSGCAAAGATFYLSTAGETGATGSLLALNSQDGHQIWKSAPGAPRDAAGALTPTVAGSMIAVYLQSAAPSTSGVKSAIAVARATDGTLVWKHDFGGRPDKVADIEGDQIYNSEYDAHQLPIMAAYSLTTGAPLWTYAIGHG